MYRIFATAAVALGAVFILAGGSASAATPAAPAAPQPKTYTVQSGDYLEKIAGQNNTTYLRIYYANNEIANPDLIFPGQTVRIPAEDEQLTPRELPTNAPAAEVEKVQANPAAETAPAAAATTYRPVQASSAAVAGGSVWDQLAQCESSGNWAINTGNGFYGGLQFTLSSWQAMGGSGYPNQASREEQIARAEKLLAAQGWGAWPACTSKLGLR